VNVTPITVEYPEKRVPIIYSVVDVWSESSCIRNKTRDVYTLRDVRSESHYGFYTEMRDNTVRAKISRFSDEFCRAFLVLKLFRKFS